MVLAAGEVVGDLLAVVVRDAPHLPPHELVAFAEELLDAARAAVAHLREQLAELALDREAAFGTRDRAGEILRKMNDAGILGRKSGAGFYRYEGKQQTPNETLQEWRQASGGNTAAEEITRRLTFLMVNEAARCLEEKVVATPEDADYGMVLGTGFPAFRGGPLRYAEHYGLRKLATEMVGLRERAGEKFAPCDLLRQHAQNGTTFYER